MFDEKKKLGGDIHNEEPIGPGKDQHENPHGPKPEHPHRPKPDHPPVHEKSVTIYVNGRPHKWEKPRISFEEVIALAFGNYDAAPHIAYTVSYFDGPRDFKEGKLTKGHSIPVKDGEKINADRTDRS